MYHLHEYMSVTSQPLLAFSGVSTWIPPNQPLSTHKRIKARCVDAVICQPAMASDRLTQRIYFEPNLLVLSLAKDCSGHCSRQEPHDHHVPSFSTFSGLDMLLGVMQDRSLTVTVVLRPAGHQQPCNGFVDPSIKALAQVWHDRCRFFWHLRHELLKPYGNGMLLLES